MDLLLKSCRRCGTVIPYPHTYCEDCKPVITEERAENAKRTEQRYNKRRQKKNRIYKNFYSSKEWITLARVYLQDHEYRCEQCRAIAAEVHHVIPIQTDEGWIRRLDYTNLRALCIRCHNEAHDRFTVRKIGHSSTER